MPPFVWLTENACVPPRPPPKYQCLPSSHPDLAYLPDEGKTINHGRKVGGGLPACNGAFACGFDFTQTGKTAGIPTVNIPFQGGDINLFAVIDIQKALDFAVSQYNLAYCSLVRHKQWWHTAQKHPRCRAWPLSPCPRTRLCPAPHH